MTTMPTFDGKSGKFGMLEDLFQTGLKNPQSPHRRKQNKLFLHSHAW